MSTLLQRYKEYSEKPLEDAYSLPFEVYHDAEVFNLEADRIFHNDWVFICAEQEIPNAGDYFALDLAGEPIVLIRGKDNQIRALSNVCRHRGTPLLDVGFGNVEKHIVCPYHAWAYDDKGECKAVPMPGITKIDKKSHCLPHFNLDSWMGLLFVNLSKQPVPLREKYGAIDDYVAIYEPQRFNKGSSGEMEYWNSNWKLAMENAMESYHLFKVHKQTLETVTPTRQAYYVAGSSEWTLTGGKMIDYSSKLMKWFRGKTPEAYDHYMLISLPPSFVGILSYDSLGWIQVLPTDGEHSFIRSGYIAEAGMGREDKASQEFTQAFFEEDKVICERVQSGMYSQHSEGGQLVELERVVVDFHQYIASRLFESPVTPFHQDENAKIFLEAY